MLLIVVDNRSLNSLLKRAIRVDVLGNYQLLMVQIYNAKI